MTGRALVARLDSAGDVLLSGPAVRAVAGAAEEVWMLCSSRGSEAAHLLPGVDHVLEWDCPWITADPPPVSSAMLEQLAGLLSHARPDVAVILTSFHQSPLPLALMLRQAGVPRIVGASVDHAGTLLDVRLRPGEDFPEDQPESERALTIAAAAGFLLPPSDDRALRIDLDTSPEVEIGYARYVVVHPGGAAPARTWPASSYRALVEMLGSAGRNVVVTGSAGEAELTAMVSGSGSRARDLGGRTNLGSLARVFEKADVVVVGNTGPAHLAAAVGTPVVSLFAPVVPAIKWAPHGVPRIILGDQDAPCRDTRATTCPVPGHPCLSAVRPEDVLAACADLAPLSAGAVA